MGKVKNKDDVVAYTMRLNLTHPDQLEIHQKLQALNRNVYKSQNAFMIEAVLRMIKATPKDMLVEEAELEQNGKNHYLTWSDMEKIEAKVYDKVMKEIVIILCSSLARKTVQLPQINPMEAKETQEIKTERLEEDETLSSLSDIWS